MTTKENYIDEKIEKSDEEILSEIKNISIEDMESSLKGLERERKLLNVLSGSYWYENIELRNKREKKNMELDNIEIYFKRCLELKLKSLTKSLSTK